MGLMQSGGELNLPYEMIWHQRQKSILSWRLRCGSRAPIPRNVWAMSCREAATISVWISLALADMWPA